MNYINIDALINSLTDIMREMPTPTELYDDGIYAGLDRALQLIIHQPVVDITPVVHGQWVKEFRESYLPIEYDENGGLKTHLYTLYQCSVCGRYEHQQEPYCHCGAKMDNDEDFTISPETIDSLYNLLGMPDRKLYEYVWNMYELTEEYLCG